MDLRLRHFLLHCDGEAERLFQPSEGRVHAAREANGAPCFRRRHRHARLLFVRVEEEGEPGRCVSAAAAFGKHETTKFMK